MIRNLKVNNKKLWMVLRVSWCHVFTSLMTPPLLLTMLGPHKRGSEGDSPWHEPVTEMFHQQFVFVWTLMPSFLLKAKAMFPLPTDIVPTTKFI
jgi:hypothetical protein